MPPWLESLNQFADQPPGAILRALLMGDQQRQVLFPFAEDLPESSNVRCTISRDLYEALYDRFCSQRGESL